MRSRPFKIRFTINWKFHTNCLECQGNVREFYIVSSVGTLTARPIFTFYASNNVAWRKLIAIWGTQFHQTPVKGSKSPKTPKMLPPKGILQPNEKCLITFQRIEIDKKCQQTTYTKVTKTNRTAISFPVCRAPTGQNNFRLNINALNFASNS
jgi:hypothetical protein